MDNRVDLTVAEQRSARAVVDALEAASTNAPSDMTKAMWYALARHIRERCL